MSISTRASVVAAVPFDRVCLLAGIPAPTPEYRFCARAWRFDWAWPEHRTALEVEGGAWTGGRHTRGAGFLADMAKYNAAQVLGWTLLRCTPDTLATDATLTLIRDALALPRLRLSNGAKP